MSAKNEIEFPQPLREWSGEPELTIYLFEESGTDAYIKDMVDDWFKRCIEDMPKGYYTQSTKIKFYTPPTETEYGIWVDKWFSQFRNKGEKE